MRFRIHDRRFVPDRQSSYGAVEPELSSFLSELYATTVRLAPCALAPGPFAVRIEIDGAPEPKRVLQSISALQ